MKFRHEIKYIINMSDFYTLKQRLSAVMKPDDNTINGMYNIKSLYFDNVYDKALREKIDGVNIREKFRIRYYNDDTDFIRLEKKSKINGLCNKVSERISDEEVLRIIYGDYEWMNDKSRPLVYELFSKIKSEGLRPKTIVEYDRIPFVYAPGNVRVTLDYNVRTGVDFKRFLERDCVTIPASYGDIILEVKWDEFLPETVRSAVSLGNGSCGAFSKYASCRIYG